MQAIAERQWNFDSVAIAESIGQDLDISTISTTGIVRVLMQQINTAKCHENLRLFVTTGGLRLSLCVIVRGW